MDWRESKMECLEYILAVSISYIMLQLIIDGILRKYILHRYMYR